MPRVLTLAQAVALLRPHTNVYIPGMSAESIALIRALEEDCSRARKVTFAGVWVPGVNRFDYSSLHEQARAIGFFVPPEFHASFVSGRLQFHPLPYTSINSFLTSRLACDVAFLHLSPPDGSGVCSTGIAADFAPAIWSNAKVKIGLLNSCMPRTQAPGIRLQDLDYAVESESELIAQEPGAVDAVMKKIAANVASLIGDGATLQIGTGTLPRAVLGTLRDRRDLKVHSGMITDEVLDLLDAGALATEGPPIKTGVALGSRELYERLAFESAVTFHPVPATHGLDEIRRIPRFIALNSAVTVDLFGQVNVEVINGRQISGVGGITDFVRGANASVGGRAIIALPSATRTGVSRIIARQPAGTPIAVPRSEPVTVVTEHGIADLGDLSLGARAEALISIADPAARADLADQWRHGHFRLQRPVATHGGTPA